MTSGDTATVGCTASPGFDCSYAAFRIPALVNAGGVLIAFAEGRRFSCSDFGTSPSGVANNGTNGQHDLVYRRSTTDGAGWGPLSRAVDVDAVFPPSRFPTQHGSAVWDITPVFDRDTKEVFVFFAGPGRQAGERTDIYALSSTDSGSSWGAPANLSGSCAPGGGSLTPGDGAGMQVSTGRLIVPLYGAGISVCFSDDHGRTWKASRGKVGGILATEPEITEQFGRPGDAPVLYMTVRNDQPGLPRQYTTSSDLGETWGPLRSLLDVRDPDCKGGVARWEAGRALVLTHADSCTARANTTVRLSLDSGVTFPYSARIDALSGYSTAAMVGANLSGTDTIGVLYEHFVEQGKTNCSVVFAAANASAILAAGASPPPPPLPPLGRRAAVMPGQPPVHVRLGLPKQLRNSSSGDANLRSRAHVQSLVLGNGVSVLGNGSCSTGGCLWLTMGSHSSKVDLGAHHDQTSHASWQFEGDIPTCAELFATHGWDMATCEARRARGMCTAAVLDACGNHEDCRPSLCRSSGTQVLAATSVWKSLHRFDSLWLFI